MEVKGGSRRPEVGVECRWEVIGRAWEVIGRTWEVRGRAWKVRGSAWEVRGTAWEVRGRACKVSGRAWRPKAGHGGQSRTLKSRGRPRKPELGPRGPVVYIKGQIWTSEDRFLPF